MPLTYAFAGNSIEFFANLLNSLLLSFSICRVINTKEKVNILIDRIIIAAAIIGLFGIIECITRYNVINNFRSDPYIEVRNGIYRISTTFDHPLVYANYLGMILVLLVYRINTAINKKKRRSFIYIYILEFINLLFTVSRSSIIIVIALQILIFYCVHTRAENISKKNKNLLKLILIPLIVISACAITTLSDYSDYSIGTIFQEFFSGGITNVRALGDRFILYSLVWAATKGNRIWGNGIEALLNYQRSYYYVKNSIEVEYLNTFFRFGFAGLTVEIMGFINLFFVFYNKSSKNNKKETDYCGYLVFLILGYCMQLFAVTRQSELRLFYVLISSGLCYRYIRDNDAAKNISEFN